MQRLWRAVPVALVTVVGACYLSTLATAVLGHDHGEYVTTGNEGGAPHPPGYPLYVLWLRAWSWLPVGGVLRTSLGTAALGLGAVALLYAAARRWGASPAAAALGAALFGLSPRIWLLHTHADNLAMASLQGAAVLWLVASPARPLVRALLLGLLAGTAVCSHHTLFALAPLLSWGLACAARSASGEDQSAPASPPAPLASEPAAGWWATQAPTLSAPVIRLTRLARRRAGELRAWVARRGRTVFLAWTRVSLAALGGLAMGLLPFAYPLWLARAEDGRWLWGRLLTLDDLVRYVGRREYGFWNLTAARSDTVPDMPTRMLGLAHRLGHDLLWLPALLGVLTGLWAVVRLVRHRHDENAWRLAALTAAFALAGPTLSLLNDAPLDAMEGHFVGRLDAIAELTLCLLLTCGVGELTRRLTERGRAARLGPPVALLTVVLVASARSWTSVRETHRPTVQMYLTNLLTSLPPGAIVVGGGDLPLFGLLSLQRIERLRPDVVHVSTMMLPRPWYQARIARALAPSSIPMDGPALREDALLASLLATGRPVFVLDASEGVRSAFSVTPEGVPLRVLPPGTTPPSAEALEARQRDLFDRYSLEPQPPRPGSFGARVYRDYARSWRLVADRYTAQGQPGDAARMAARAATFAPP